MKQFRTKKEAAAFLRAEAEIEKIEKMREEGAFINLRPILGYAN